MDIAETSTKPPSPRAAWVTLALAAASSATLALATVSLGPRDAPSHQATSISSASVDDLVRFEEERAEVLAARLDRIWEAYPREGRVPNEVPASFPPDMGRLDVPTRKKVLVRTVLPYVIAENRRILEDRLALKGMSKRLVSGGRLSVLEMLHLTELGKAYRLLDAGESLADGEAKALVRSLLFRVDVIPPSIALAQAALESGWGSSRFLLEGNSLFGQWVFSARKGMRPRSRPDGADYSVASFDHLGEAVQAYVRNLNTLWAYEGLRRIRADLRASERELNPFAIAQGLLLYSARRGEYVDEVCRVIRANRLGRFDELPGTLGDAKDTENAQASAESAALRLDGSG